MALAQHINSRLGRLSFEYPGSAGAGPQQVAPDTGFSKDADSPIWVPDRLIRHVSASRIPSSTAAATPKEERASSAFAPPASTGNTTDIGATDIGDPG
ncbi:uncharacterized protein [Bos indicus]|uniref:Uncharacterized protein n=1 Tax=Bos indicus TaxID=9915 RepID=A0ABM4QWN5_BOSIN